MSEEKVEVKVDQEPVPAETKKKVASKAEAEAAAKAAEVEKLKQEARDEARAAILKDLGISEADIAAQKAKQEADSEQMELDIRREVVKINGQPYTGKFIVSRGTGEQILEMLNKKHTRIMNESIRREFKAERLQAGGYSWRIIKSTKEA